LITFQSWGFANLRLLLFFATVTRPDAMARVPGSPFRRILFWAHLSAGVSAGIIILIMSATGVLLAYEPQILAWAGQAAHHASGAAPALSADRLAQAARAATPDASRASLRFDSDPTAPVAVDMGRAGSVLLDAYSGTVIPDPAAGYRQFFRTVENWHRWLGGSAQGNGATVIHAANLLFFFIVLSGTYLWLPDVWRWKVLRQLLLFRGSYINGKARDFAWHHIFSSWALIPLAVVVFSGVVMSYDWANGLLFAAYGEKAPQRGGPPGFAPAFGPGAGQNAGRAGGGRAEVGGPRASLEELLAAAKLKVPNWQSLSVPLASRGPNVTVTAELKSDQRRAPRQTVTLSAVDAGFVSLSSTQAVAQSPGQRARGWIRFAHTGEQYGIVGQTLACLASLAACFLVYSGLALAWRRLIVPLYRRPRAPSLEAATMSAGKTA
jgi:uncharacterized iron-regulated membrane protein